MQGIPSVIQALSRFAPLRFEVPHIPWVALTTSLAAVCESDRCGEWFGERGAFELDRGTYAAEPKSVSARD